MSGETREALNALYNYLKPSALQQTGLVFDINFYFKAWTLLGQIFRLMGPVSGAPLANFWHMRVIEPIAYQLGTGYLRFHTRGFLKIQPGGIMQEISSNPSGCLLAHGDPYFVFRRIGVPGCHFFVNMLGLPSHDAIFDNLLNIPKSRKEFFSEMAEKKRQQREFFQKKYALPEAPQCAVS